MKIWKKIKNIPGKYKFLCFVFFIYSVLFFYDKPLAINGIEKTYSMLIKIIPLLGFVFLIMTAINLYIESGKIKKHLGSESGIKGWFYATVIGIFISGPPYVLFPMLKDLKKSGMKNSLLAVFLYNRNVKISFIPVMIYYFGLKFTIVTSIIIILFSILNGILIGFFVKDKVA